MDPAKKAKVIEFCPKEMVARSFNEIFYGAVDSFAEYHKIEYDPHLSNDIQQTELISRELPYIDIMQIKSILETK